MAGRLGAAGHGRAPCPGNLACWAPIMRQPGSPPLAGECYGVWAARVVWGGSGGSRSRPRVHARACSHERTGSTSRPSPGPACRPGGTTAWDPSCRQDSSFGPKLHTGEALLMIGTPAAAIQLAPKEPHPRPTAGVRPTAASPGCGTSPVLWPLLRHITGVRSKPHYPGYVPSRG